MTTGAISSAAQREGELVIVSAARGNPVLPELARRFQERHGIRVTLREARTEACVAAIRSEQAAGYVTADLSHNGATATALLSGEGRLAPRGALPNLARLHLDFSPAIARDRCIVPTFVVHYGILVNTDLVPAAERPATWRDLLHPRWRGRILCDDLREIGAGGVLFKVLFDLYGEAFHRELARLEPRFSLESRELEQRIARGEYAMLLPLTWPNLAGLAGLPVAGVMPEEGAPYVRFDTAVLAGAPHPHAARAFLDHLLGEEAQAVYGEAGFGPVAGGPAGGPGAKLLGTTDPLQTSRMLALAREIYG